MLRCRRRSVVAAGATEWQATEARCRRGLGVPVGVVAHPCVRVLRRGQLRADGCRRRLIRADRVDGGGPCRGAGAAHAMPVPVGANGTIPASAMATAAAVMSLATASEKRGMSAPFCARTLQLSAQGYRCSLSRTYEYPLEPTSVASPMLHDDGYLSWRGGTAATASIGSRTRHRERRASTPGDGDGSEACL